MVLVTPVWNDSARLEVFGTRLARALAEASLPIRWIIADDGSLPEEQARYTLLQKRFAETYPHVDCLRLEARSRKGGAIYAAWSAHPEADWLAFVDADGAISPETLLELIGEASRKEHPGATIGVRTGRGPKKVQRSPSRWLGFHAFRLLVRLLAGIQFYDTQCGVKVLPGDAFRKVERTLQERGFVFDVELLTALQANGCEIEEVPIHWQEIPGSRMAPLRDAPEMIRALARVGRRRQAGGYTTGTRDR